MSYTVRHALHLTVQNKRGYSFGRTYKSRYHNGVITVIDTWANHLMKKSEKDWTRDRSKPQGNRDNRLLQVNTKTGKIKYYRNVSSCFGSICISKCARFATYISIALEGAGKQEDIWDYHKRGGKHAYDSDGNYLYRCQGIDIDKLDYKITVMPNGDEVQNTELSAYRIIDGIKVLRVYNYWYNKDGTSHEKWGYHLLKTKCRARHYRMVKDKAGKIKFYRGRVGRWHYTLEEDYRIKDAEYLGIPNEAQNAQISALLVADNI